MTCLNVPQLERQDADLQNKIEELQLINQSLRENDKVKEDALVHRSDQLLVLTERIKEWEPKKWDNIITKLHTNNLEKDM